MIAIFSISHRAPATKVSAYLRRYAQQEGIQYKSAWERFRKGNIPGAYRTETGRVVVPSAEDNLRDKAAIYARVSTHAQKDDLERQSERLSEFATARGLQVVRTVLEVASGVNDSRPKLASLITRSSDYGVLIVEHRDRLTRVGFGWFPLFLEQMGKELIVADDTADSDEGKASDVYSLLYSLAASEYGKRGAANRAQRAAEALDSPE